MWKGKLAREARGVSRHAGAKPALVTVRIKRGAAVEPLDAPVHDLSRGLLVRLPNGVVAEFEARGAREMTALLDELARLRC